jgi:predicted transcriptional regulator YdeE
MAPAFVDRAAFTVMGLQERFTRETEDFEGIWKRYMTYHDQVQPLSTDGAHYGVCFGAEDAMDYVAGMAVPAGTPCIDGLVVRDVPAARDAVFECTVATIHDAYEYIHHTWLGTSPYAHDDPKPDFERYPPGTESGDSPVFIHVPVRPAQ